MYLSFWCFAFVSYIESVWFISILGLMACGFKLAVVICGNGNALKKR